MRKLFLASAFGVLLIFGTAGIALATMGVAAKHDFSGAGYSKEDNCAFCHTPRIGGTADPQWGTPTAEGGNFLSFTEDDKTSNNPQGVSMACLSCHDGTIAVDSYTDRKGAGGDNDDDSMMGDSGGAVDHPVSVTYDPGGNSDLMAKSVVAAVLPLYGGNSDQIQCGTCHDPHNDEAGMLRVSNARSSLCMTCHLM